MVWDAESGRPVHTLREHKHLVCEVAFSPDGRLLASSSLDGTVKIHEAATGRLVRTVVAGDPEPAGQRVRACGPQSRGVCADGQVVAIEHVESTRSPCGTSPRNASRPPAGLRQRLYEGVVQPRRPAARDALAIH